MERLTVTAESFKLMLRHLIHVYERQLPNPRKKYDKACLEDHASMSAFLIWICSEITANYPISQQQLDADFLQSYVDGDINLELALQAAIHEKAKDFDISMFPFVSELLFKHSANSDIRVGAI